MGLYAREKTYRVTSVGPDELLEYEFEKIPDDLKWLVYWYEASAYEGYGTAIFKCADGTYGYEDLSHCSCYGPAEKSSWTTDGLNAIGVRKLLRFDPDVGDGRKRSADDYDYARWAALAPVVRKLLR